MQRGVAWLRQELPRLVELGVLTPDAAEALRQHYAAIPGDGVRTRWGQLLLVSLGALLVGGGLILILAHNWEVLGRPARAAIALGILIAAQALTIYAVARRRGSALWAEASSGLLVAAVGAAISLVGQTYHVGGTFDGLMRAWLWLVVAVPYLTGSCLAAVEFWVLLAVYATGLRSNAPPDPWLLVFAAAPFVLLRVRRAPLSWATTLVLGVAAVSVFFVGSLGTLTAWRGLWAPFQVGFLGTLIAAALWPHGTERRDAWRRLLVPAWVILIIVATILSFDDTWRGVDFSRREAGYVNIAIITGVIVSCAVFATVVSARLVRSRRFGLAISTAAPAIALSTYALAFAGVEDAGWIAFNLWLLAVGTVLLLEGIRDLRLGIANLGLLAIAALVLARFLDSDLSFLARGVAFVVLGIACFALNLVLMQRLRRQVR